MWDDDSLLFEHTSQLPNKSDSASLCSFKWKDAKSFNLDDLCALATGSDYMLCSVYKQTCI